MMFRLFLVPFLIVAVLIGLYLVGQTLYGKLGRTRSPEKVLADLDNPNADVRWRAAADLSQAETGTVLLVQAEAGAPELKLRLVNPDKSEREPDVAAPSLGLYLFRVSGAESPQALLERVRISGPSELLPARPLRARLDALSANPELPLVTRELTLPNGKELALAP